MNRPSVFSVLASFLLLFFVSVSGAAEQFNTTDKDLITNGNILVAVKKLKDIKPEELNASAQKITMTELTKKIYPSLGKPIKLTGKVYKVEELPPDANLPGVWTEVLLLTKNPNSPMGVTTLEFLYHGDSNNINAGQFITCTGYLVGTFDSVNAMGGSVEGVLLMGNHFAKTPR